MPSTYYVYSLKDPREKPAKTFYIGKGTGSRATDHLKKADDTRKGKYSLHGVKHGRHGLVGRLVREECSHASRELDQPIHSVSCHGIGGVHFKVGAIGA